MRGNEKLALATTLLLISAVSGCDQLSRCMEDLGKHASAAPSRPDVQTPEKASGTIDLSSARPTEPSPPNLPSNGAHSDEGRYRVFFSPNVRADTFLVDTQEGRVWRSTKLMDVQDQPDAWVPMDVIDDSETVGVTWKAYLAEHPLSKPASTTGKKRPPNSDDQ